MARVVQDNQTSIGGQTRRRSTTNQNIRRTYAVRMQPQTHNQTLSCVLHASTRAAAAHSLPAARIASSSSSSSLFMRRRVTFCDGRHSVTDTRHSLSLPHTTWHMQPCYDSTRYMPWPRVSVSGIVSWYCINLKSRK